MKNVRIQRYQLNYVRMHDGELFNVNNLYGDKQPKDYQETGNLGNTRNWINHFHKGNYQILRLPGEDIKWMKEAVRIGLVTKRFSHIYDDDLEYTCKKYHEEFESIKKNDPIGAEKGWFIRVEKYSLKYGLHGKGPYKNLEEIIQSLVTSSLGHECIKPDDEDCLIYFMKWLDLDPYKEFRIFVCNNKITAISDQNLYKVNKWLNKKTDSDIQNLVNKIISYFEENITSKMEFIGSYVMDLALVGEDETPYFIEPNPFGKDYSSGSALYHWIYDHDTLHNDDFVEFRYCYE